MQRFKLTIEYDGRPFSGWQRQKDAPSVQQVLEQASARFLEGEEAAVTGSGRTDAGVHAIGQVAHIDISRSMTTDEVQGALNYHIKPHPVSILSVEEVDSEFHARFSARQRHYVYKIRNRRGPLTFDCGLVWHVKDLLNADAMHDAAQVLIGRHDFTTFRHIHCQSQSPVKTVDYLTVERVGENIAIMAGARSFLHHQIRSFVGALKFVGAGRITKDDLRDMLEAKDRAALVYNAPSDGLYFRRVDY